MAEIIESPEREPNRHHVWTLVAISFYYFVGYVCFTIFSAFCSELGFWFFRAVYWSNAGLTLAVLLYMSVIGLIFYGCGRLMSRSYLKKRLLLLSVLPVAVLGSIIWMLTAASRTGSAADIGDLSWMFYRLYIFWSHSVLEVLEVYITDPVRIKYIALAACWFPSLAAAAGILLPSGGIQKRTSRAVVWRSLALPLVLLAGLGLTWALPRTAPFDLNTYPKVDGATAAVPFGELLVQRLTGVSTYKAKEAVQFHTTHNAYVNLIEKKADLIFAAGPSDEERKLAEEKGVGLKLTPIGKDAFIFLVHRDNPVQDLTVDQLKLIYSGLTTNWKELGGEDEPIVAFQREKNSGSQTYMEQKVMGSLKLAEPPKESKIGGMGELINAVADYQNSKRSIGYSFYYFASEMHRREEVKFLSVNGVEPNKEHIRSAVYPFTATLYAVTREDEPADSPANRVVAWIRSEEGKQAVEDGGFVPLQGE